MTEGKSSARGLRLTRRALNILTVAIYLIAASQALRGILPDIPARALAHGVSLTLH